MLNLHASPTCSRIDTWGGDQTRGHFRTLTHTLSSPLPLVPALTFLIRLRRQALLLPGRPQSSKPGAASAAAAAMLHPPTHIWQRLWHFLLSQLEGRRHQPPWVEAGGSYPTQAQIRSKSEWTSPLSKSTTQLHLLQTARQPKRGRVVVGMGTSPRGSGI